MSEVKSKTEPTSKAKSAVDCRVSKPFKIYEQLFLGVGKTLMGEYATEEIAKMELAKLNRKADSYTFYNIG